MPEFEKVSGLKVELTQLGEDQLSDQYNVKLNAGSGDIDVMMYRPLQEGKLFAKNKYLADLGTRSRPTTTGTGSDFQAGPVGSTTTGQGGRRADHHRAGGPVLPQGPAGGRRHRGPAKTLDELKAAAKKIAAANHGVAGFVARTGKSAAVTQFSSFLYSFGGDFIDGSGKSTIDTPQAKQAYAFYGGLLHNHGPKNVSTDMSWPAGHGDLHPGQRGVLHGGRLPVQERDRPSQVQGRRQVGFAAFRPGRPARSRTTCRPGRWASTRRPKNQENAWKFIAVGDEQGAHAGGTEGRRPRRRARPSGPTRRARDLPEGPGRAPSP